ncbi:hypothetical protein [Limnohabitans sp. B9-3]|uniref:hypothetical protein n=1 Tax=Limnohabitans sp. B9-3 TaxID=1100707 RepID=UPI000C1F715F|nr:hypothetical protein [Limnohabitans sp. B9-3]PIT75260.1 hypothetical protein B9Z42_07755 [Limnohabitans sp. B9-3]
MNSTDLKMNTYVPAAQAQFAAPVSFDRRDFLARSVSVVLRISSNIELGAESSLLAREVLSPPSGTHEFVPYDDLTPLEKAARRLMTVISSAKEGSHNIFTEEEIIALAFDAGCDVTEVEDANGAVLLPIKMIRVERRSDGLIVVFEDCATEGVVLEREPPSPQV